MKITKEMREDAIEILRCCADNGMHGSGGWTGRVAECLGYRVYGKEERLADKAWWAAYGLRSSPMDHATICLEAAAWLEEGGTP